MATQDLASNVKTVLAQLTSVDANGAAEGSTIDTAGYDLGVMFAIQCLAWIDGAHQLSLEESDNGSDWTAVPAAKVIGSVDSVDDGTAVGGTLGKIGVFSNLRYVRSVITSTGVTDGATLNVLCTLGAELMPV